MHIIRPRPSGGDFCISKNRQSRNKHPGIGQQENENAIIRGLVKNGATAKFRQLTPTLPGSHANRARLHPPQGRSNVTIPVRGRSIITLFSKPGAYESDRIRYILSIKNINVDIVNVDIHDPPEDLMDVNPYASLPTLVDRDLAVYGMNVITDYLDERYPHPPLMPPDPVGRAKLRVAAYHMERDWLQHLDTIDNGDGEEKQAILETLAAKLDAAADLFRSSPYFLSSELTLLDTMLVPFLWRLVQHDLDWEGLSKPIRTYAHRMFNDLAFRRSVAHAERGMRFDF